MINSNFICLHFFVTIDTVPTGGHYVNYCICHVDSVTYVVELFTYQINLNKLNIILYNFKRFSNNSVSFKPTFSFHIPFNLHVVEYIIIDLNYILNYIHNIY